MWDQGPSARRRCQGSSPQLSTRGYIFDVTCGEPRAPRCVLGAKMSYPVSISKPANHLPKLPSFPSPHFDFFGKSITRVRSRCQESPTRTLHVYMRQVNFKYLLNRDYRYLNDWSWQDHLGYLLDSLIDSALYNTFIFGTGPI